MGRPARPGLVGSFAFGALVVFVIVGVALWLFFSTQLKAKQEDFAQFHAVFVTRSILDHEVALDDLNAPMTGGGADVTRQLVRSRILVYPVVGIRVWGRDGTILFSDNPSLTGRRYLDPHVTDALGGGTFSAIEASRDTVNASDPKLPANLFATYLPLRPKGAAADAAPTAVVEVLQDYGGVQASFGELSRTLALILAVGLTVLFVLLLPVLRRSARRLSDQTVALRKNEARLLAMNEELIEASRLKSEFMANISHELRTPLTGIIGFAELLHGGVDGDLSVPQTEDVGQIEQSGRTLLELIDGILELSKIDAGMVTVSAERFNVNETVEDVVASLEPLAKAKNLPIKMDIEQASRWAVGDADRVRQIMTNLVSNAIKFTSQGLVDIRGRLVGGMVEISVEDTGIGLSRAAARYIFDGFCQADGSVTRRFGGAGLGLATARKLVELQGGQMGVDSTEGKGSRFWFTLRSELEPQPVGSTARQLRSVV